MKKFTLLALITAALLTVSNDGKALRGGTTHVAKEAIGKKVLQLVGKGTAYPFVKTYGGAKHVAKWVIDPVRLDRAWTKTALRGASAYLVLSLAVLPLCSNFVCGSRDASLIADRLVRGRIPAGEKKKLVMYPDGEGEQKFGVERDSWLVFWPNDAHYSAVAPLTGYRDFVPFVDADGIHSADGIWQVINSDWLPDIFLAKRVGRGEVVKLSIESEITGNVRINEESSALFGQGIVKLADKNSDKEFYAVLIDKKFELETLEDGGEALLVEQDIESYFKFLTPQEFAASKVD